LKLQKVAVVSKVGSKESEDAAKNVAKKFLAKKSKVFTIAPIEVEGAKKVETLDELKKQKTFKNWELLRISRLSVMPVPKDIWDAIIKISQN